MPQNEYETTFDTDSPESEKLKFTFAQVADTRKFEIELYWKRATYFWTLIAVAFAGYFSILGSSQIPNKYFLTLVVGSIGLVFTFGWYLANRGSKYWQENWENHIDLLEDNITGPLYKTLLERPGYETLSELLVTGPLSVSVSKINQWVSVFVLFVWLGLVAFSGYKSLSPLNLSIDLWLTLSAHGSVIVAAILCCFMMIYRGRTHKGPHEPNMRVRETKLGGRV